VNGEVAGICGSVKRRFIPRLYIVVRKKFQYKGVGKALHIKLSESVRQKYIIVKVIVRKNNKKALALYKDVDYRVIREDAEFYYMIRMTKYHFLLPAVVLLFKFISRIGFTVKYRLNVFGGTR